MSTSIHHFGIILAISAAILAVANGGIAGETRLVSPSQFANSESHDSLPPIPGGAGRAQFLFEATDFSSLVGPHWITQFAWRPDGSQTTDTVTATSERVLFRMSTTEKTVGNMSMTYANNIGSDEQVVLQFDEPQATTVPVLGPDGGPKEFTIFDALETPFLYDPSKGNLLLDMELVSGSTLPADNVATPSNTLTTKWIAGPLNAPRAFKQFGGIVTQFTFVPVIKGDYDKSGELDLNDIMLLSDQIQSDEPNLDFDLDDDATVSADDLNVWVRDLRKTWIGDSNLDGVFDSGDLVAVFQRAEYEDAIEGNSTWATGDWNADGEFDTGDLVSAFQDGGFEKGQRTSIVAVPEPTGLVLISFTFLGACLSSYRRRK